MFTNLPGLVLTIWILALVTTAHAQTQPHPVADAKGFQPNREYFGKMPFEHIDTSTGSLVLTFTDLVLPGPKGRDLKFQRTYNSKDNAWRFGLGGYPLYVSDPGWPSVGSGGETVLTMQPTITSADGAIHATSPVKPVDTTSAGGMVATLDLVTTEQFWRYTRLAKYLYLPDGTTCIFEDAGASFPQGWKRLKRCFGPTGTEELSIEWSANQMVVTQKIANQQRDVTVALNAQQLPETVTFMGKEWDYDWTFDSLGYVTTARVTPPAGAAWEINRPSGMPTILTVKTPFGGEIRYLLENQEFPQWSEPESMRYSVVVAKRTAVDRDQTTGPEWTYTYGNRTSDGSTLVSTPTGRTIRYRHELGDARLKEREVLVQQGEALVAVEREVLTYRAVPVVELDPNPCSACYQITKSVMTVETRQLTRDGRAHLTAYEFRTTNRADYHRPSKIIETANGSIRVTERSYEHADDSTGPLNVGHLKNEKVNVNGANTVERSWSVYAGTGTITSHTIDGVVTDFLSHTALGQPTTVRDANGTVTQLAYDWGIVSRVITPIDVFERQIAPNGTLTSETQGVGTPNPRKTSYRYDNAFRLKEITLPDGGTGRTSTTIDYLLDQAGRNEKAETKRGAATSTTKVDGFGRPIERKDSTGITTTTRYDADGRTVFEGYPMAGTATPIGTTIEYDALGRVVKRKNPDNTERTMSYGTGTVTIVDEKGRPTIRRVEAFGNPDDARLVGLTDADNKNWTYTYDTLGKLKSVAAPDNKLRTWQYDPTTTWLLTQTHPESGSTSFTYDAIGNVKTKTDAKGQVMTYEYDAKNRLKKITAGAEVVDLTYEVGSDHRKTVSVGPVTTTYLYDGGGRLEGLNVVLDGKRFDIRYAQDANDNVTSTLYPTRRRVSYDFNSENQITRVQDVLSGVDYASGLQYHPSGALTRYVAGNQTVFEFGYHGTRYWPTAISAGPLYLAYYYDETIGNVTAIDDSRGTAWRQTFDYDALDRLTSATGSYGALTYTYDEHGNMKTQGADTFTYSPDSLRLTARNSQGIGYDDNGSMTSGINGGTFNYTFRNQMKTANMPGGTTTYQYDADEWRVMKTTPAGTTYYFRGPRGELLTEMTFPATGAPSQRDYIYAGSRLLAVVEQ